MLWEVTISPNKGSDQESDRVREEYNLLTHSRLGNDLIAGNARRLSPGRGTERGPGGAACLESCWLTA